MNKIGITTSSFGKFDDGILERLRSEFEVVLNPHGRKLKADEVVELCGDMVGIIAGTEPLNAGVLEKLPRLQVISRCGTGMDNVDLEAAGRLGIRVFNTPDAPTLAVAELAVGLILNLLRKVGIMDRAVRANKWEKLMGNLLSGKKVGIIGYGRIGQKLGLLLHHLGAELAYCDVEPKACALNCGKKGLEDILQWADIVTLHLSPPKDCGTLIGAREIEAMRKGSWLVNLSRGGVVDEGALYEALKSGHLAGAALDVFEREPYDGPLRELDNVILTPHIGSYAVESRVAMERQAAENLLHGLEGFGEPKRK
jgi:D-3-phosphoglycerate dehydrogenase